ncbi:UNVERIFIED_CONTAM: DNA-directed RNA polymerase I subunit rpa49 [Siphonaria sp. JEL0065]|nr:DNA-directed RNA polymerase I subunit rpa49 [Siphonaria sp. JEL0065]
MKFEAANTPTHPPICASFSDDLNGLTSASFQSFTSIPPPASSGLTATTTDRIVVAGLDRVELRADTREAPAPLVRYVVGVVDKSSNTVKFCEAPQLRFKTVVKARSQFKPTQIGIKNTLARHILGETFGTIKRKKAISAQERNKVKVDSLVSAEQVLKTVIDDSEALLPTLDSIKQEQDSNRLIPPFKINATTPAEVYKLESIMTASELSSIDVDFILEIKFKEDLKEELDKVHPSSWVFTRVFEALQTNQDKAKIQKYIYILFMMKFLTAGPGSIRKGTPLPSYVAPQITASMMEKFTEQQQDGDRGIKIAFPDRLKDKLRSYIMCACLLVDGYRLDVDTIASDLKLSGIKVSTTCRELGCAIEISKKGNAEKKTAKLVVPLKFPVKTGAKR